MCLPNFFLLTWEEFLQNSGYKQAVCQTYVLQVSFLTLWLAFLLSGEQKFLT